VRETSENRTQRGRGKALSPLPEEKHRAVNEVFGIVEKVEAPDDETLIPERIARQKGYITLEQLARVIDVPVAYLQRAHHYYRRSGPRRPPLPKSVGYLQMDGRVKGQNARLYKRDELLGWVQSYPLFNNRIPPELKRTKKKK
jgi:hypothetical protein